VAAATSGASNLANADLGSDMPALTADAVPAGTYFIRVRGKNAAGVSAPSNEIALTVGSVSPCVSAPSAPHGLIGSAAGSTVTLAWSAGPSACPATAYIIEAGSAPGLANLAAVNTGTTATTFSANGVGAGTYYIRIRAVNAVGSSPPSNEVVITVGTTTTCTAPPAAPSALLTSAIGSTVTLAWTGSAGATSYVIEAGSAPSLANLVVSDTGSTATSLTATGRSGHLLCASAREERMRHQRAIE